MARKKSAHLGQQKVPGIFRTNEKMCHHLLHSTDTHIPLPQAEAMKLHLELLVLPAMI